MKRIFTLFLFISTVSINCFSQNNLCHGADPFCTGITFSFPAGVNQPSAESGPNYGCLYSQPNPVWYYLLIDQPGDFQIDIHTVPNYDIDFVCWGPFTSQTAPCTSQLTATGPTPSHNGPLSSPDYPAGNMIDCGYNPTYQEWCYIPNAQTGQYYILMITNYSNSVCNIVMKQIITGLTNAGSTNCNACKCGSFDNVTYTINPCNPITNQYSVTGSMIYHFTGGQVATGTLTITDSPSGATYSVSAPFNSTTTNYIISGILSNDTQHTLTAVFSDAPSDIYTLSYQAPGICDTCIINAGNNLQVCGLTTPLNAVENISDVNTHWMPQAGINFNTINEPVSIVTASTYGTYYLYWQITNNSGSICTDSVTIEFIDPALCTSVSGNSSSESFTVFPNPASNNNFKINYSSKSFENISIRILSLQGNEVLNIHISKNTESIEIPINSVNFVKGYYFIELNDGNKVIRKPLIIQ